MTSFQKGDEILTCDGRTVPGKIEIASANAVSLMISFEALLHGHAGMMPLLLHDGGYRSIEDGVAVTLEKAK
jgi:hypothetical protein